MIEVSRAKFFLYTYVIFLSKRIFVLHLRLEKIQNDESHDNILSIEKLKLAVTRVLSFMPATLFKMKKIIGL